jgi:hypothetical protein
MDKIPKKGRLVVKVSGGSVSAALLIQASSGSLS